MATTTQSDQPETKSTYRLYRQALYDDGTIGPWQPTDYASDDRATIEAMAERFAVNQEPRWSDRRNYAAVEVKSRPVRVFLAPMRAG